MKVLDCGWRIGFGKLKREDDEMSRGFSRVKHGFWKGCRGMEQDFEIFGLSLKFGYGKVNGKIMR